LIAFPTNLEIDEAKVNPTKYVAIIINDVPVIFELMIPTSSFESFLLSDRRVKKFILSRIRGLESKYIPSLQDESFGLGEILSNNAVLQLFIEEIVPRRLGMKASVTLKEKVDAFFSNIKRINIPLQNGDETEDRFIRIMSDIDKFHRLRQEYIIARTELSRKKSTGFLSVILRDLRIDSIIYMNGYFYELKRIRNNNGIKIYRVTRKLHSIKDFFMKFYKPILTNYLNSLAIVYVWETKERFFNKLLKNIPANLVRLVLGASRSKRWFIEVTDIGLERRGEKHYLYAWTGNFALIELLNDRERGNLYLFPSFKVAVPFNVKKNKIEISPAVVLDPPTLHPFLSSSTTSERSICFGKTTQAYSNISKRGDVSALLTALEMAINMIREGYVHGASPYRTLGECGVRQVNFDYLKRRNIPITNLKDRDALQLLRKKWKVKI